MKFLIDNNLPPSLARSLHELCVADGHIVTHLRDKFAQNTQDVEWVGALAKEGDWAIVTQDNFRKGSLEKQMLRDCGLVVFCLAKHWASETFWNKAYNLVRWWPEIMQQAERISGGAAFRVPWKFGRKAKFEQIKIK